MYQATAGTINFVSTLPSNFTVNVGADSGGHTDGTWHRYLQRRQLFGYRRRTAMNMKAVQVGAGSTADIGSLTGATAAVAAVSAAVGKMGTAQAAVGNGENQLGYAINLATSQITNFSAAESQIRDADIGATGRQSDQSPDLAASLHRCHGAGQLRSPSDPFAALEGLSLERLTRRRARKNGCAAGLTRISRGFRREAR